MDDPLGNSINHHMRRPLTCLLAVALLTLCNSAMAVTNTVACTYAAISSALGSAAEGDVVLIQPGSCTITSEIDINRNVSFTIRGSGTNLTTLISGSGLNIVINVLSDSTNVFTVSDLNCVGDAANGGGFFATGGNPPCTPMSGLVHFYNIRMTNCLSRGIVIGYGDSFGLIDHCYFRCPVGAGSFNPVAFGGNEYLSWSNAIPLGTTNVCVVEDCYFKEDGDNVGNGFFDGYNGCQVVVRHNVFDGIAANGCHGYDSQVTSMRTQELYNNVFTNIDSATVAMCLSRGGVFMCFSNTIWVSSPSVNAGELSPTLTYYHGCWGDQRGIYGFAGYDLTNGLNGWFTGLGTSPYEQVNPTPRSSNFSDGDVVDSVSWQQNLTMDSTLQQLNHHVKIGATLADSVANIAAAINATPSGAGTQYGSPTVKNVDFMVVSNGGTYLILRNRMDGTNAYGYPGAMQPGVIGVTKFTNSGVTLYPCYSCSNLVHNYNGTTENINFKVAYTDAFFGLPNNETNLIISGRDFYNDVKPSYTLLQYPHPLQALEGGGGGGSTPIPITISGSAVISGTLRIGP